MDEQAGVSKKRKREDIQTEVPEAPSSRAKNSVHSGTSSFSDTAASGRTRTNRSNSKAGISDPPTTPANVDGTSTTGATTPSRKSNLRRLLPILINDALQVGGRPDYAVSESAPLGERIEVRTKSSNGAPFQKIITWTVEPEVPRELDLDERDLTKLITAIVLNAVKFTDNGNISINARLSANSRFCVINIIDTGTGIPDTFRSELFKAFSQEDDSITRTREGLGLGLLVARGLARRLGGDIRLARTSVAGPDHGSDFEIRLPMEATEISSRASTPYSGPADIDAPRSVPSDYRDSPMGTSVRLDYSPDVALPTHRLGSERISPVRITTPHVIDLGQTPHRAGQADRNNSHPQTHKKVVQETRSHKPGEKCKHDQHLAEKFPLSIVVAEDNKLNRKLLVSMLGKLGYKNVHEAFDGVEAVRVADKLLRERHHSPLDARAAIDVILMDLWMPGLDGYQATEKILDMYKAQGQHSTTQLGITAMNAGPPPRILAVSADVTDRAIDKAARAGMNGYLTKPYNLMDLQNLILDFCVMKVAA